MHRRTYHDAAARDHIEGHTWAPSTCELPFNVTFFRTTRNRNFQCYPPLLFALRKRDVGRCPHPMMASDQHNVLHAVDTQSALLGKSKACVSIVVHPSSKICFSDRVFALGSNRKV